MVGVADHSTWWVWLVGVAVTVRGGRGRPQFAVGVVWRPSHLIKGPRHVPHLLDLMLEVEGKQVSVGLG